jgi:energy-coupling factor transporter ATP-binding protein EcfA2
VLVIPVRTLTREFRLRTDCRRAARIFAYVDTRPEISGAVLEPVDLAVERDEGFYRLRLSDGRLVEGTAIYVLETVHRLILGQLGQEAPGAPLIHAACARVRDLPVLLVGAKGSGKTTLVLHLLARGYGVEGDEHVVVRGTDLVTRPRNLRVKQGSLTLVPTLASAIRRAPSVADWNGLPIYAVSPSIAGRPWRIGAMRARHLVFLEPNHGGHTVAKPISTDRAFALLMARCLLPDTGKAQAVARLRAVAREAQSWEMSLGDLAGAERHLLAIAGIGKTVQ